MAAFPGWTLHNPLYSAPDERFVEAAVLGKVGQDTILTTRGISFTIQPQAHSDGIPADGLRIASEVLRRLRYVSRQFSLPQMCIASSMHQQPFDPPKALAASLDASKTMVRSYYMPTALTDQHMGQVAGLGVDFQVPVHSDVLLDALEAHVNADFRKALLYAAIALEAFGSVQLEAAAAANVGRANACHRVISLPVNARADVQKDPISNLLLEGDNFSRLLHEAPLYILGRSLLVDRPDTYRRALRLYTTRNKIAHLGAQPLDEKYFPPTAEGSTEALDAAVDAIKWFGDPGPYLVWDHKFLSLDTAAVM